MTCIIMYSILEFLLLLGICFRKIVNMSLVLKVQFFTAQKCFTKVNKELKLIEEQSMHLHVVSVELK